MEIKLDQPKEINMVPPVTITTNTIGIRYTKDDGASVIAEIIFITDNPQMDSYSRVITLWDEQSTPSYTEIGQWTDTDVANRIKEYINQPTKIQP
jgi:hypothetical protein